MQEGDLTAFDALFEKYRRGILAYASGMLGDRIEAEDVVQETFVELAKHIQSIDAERGLSGWLYRVARNRAVDIIRRRKFEIAPGEETVLGQAEKWAAGQARAEDEAAVEAETLARVKAAVSRLSEKEQEILLLRFHSGMKFQEIAELLDRPLGTVLWQVQDCMEKLRNILKQEKPE
jgi:RNA polymerase sigma-70 factor (ECF subfamily)